ncbi:MAG: HDOD domain-containing protein [Thiogranum sp.]|jgi:HD-like signal output (HDOD) protein
MNVSPDLMGVLKVLLRLRDLDDLGDVALLDLARDAKFEKLRKGQTLQAGRCLDRHVYLTEGEVELMADGRTIQSIKAGTDRALLPVFRIHTEGLEARCVNAARLLTLDEATFGRYASTLRPKQGGGIDVEEYSSTDQQTDLVEEIRQAFYHQEVDLPSMPEVALKISHALQNRDVDFRQIAILVQADPVIAARIVQVANSAMYAGVSQVESVQNAIARIGLLATRAIVMSVVLRNLYVPQSPMLQQRMRAYYQHSIRVGAIAHALATRLPGHDAERAFLAGLIHDIGVLPLLIQADRRKDLNQDAELVEQVIDELGKTIGAMLLEQWGFEAEFVTAAREAENWEREADVSDSCDIVQVAQLHCVMLGGKPIHAPPLSTLPAFRRLHLEEVDPIKLIEEARQEINEIVSLLAA